MDSIPKYIDNKKNPAHIRYACPELAPILDVTYGCLIYQEQVMQIVRDLAGYSYGRSRSSAPRDVPKEDVRHAGGKKNISSTASWTKTVRSKSRAASVTGSAARPRRSSSMIWSASRSMRSTSRTRRLTAWWLTKQATSKKHYPVEFMAALMTSVMGDTAQIARYIRNCGEHGHRGPAALR